MKSIVVTGANGYVGGRLLGALRESGYPVRGLVRTRPSVLVEDIVPVDFSDPSSISRSICGADSVVHVAGLAHVNPRRLASAEDAFRVANVDVASNVARACGMAGIQRIVLLSSAGVLGSESPVGGFTDLSPAHPYDAYTRSKLAAERSLADIAMATGIGLTILRPPMIYGANAPGSFDRLCRWIDSGWPLPVGGIIARRSLIGIYNLCEAIMSALESPALGSESVLVADERPVSVADLVRALASARSRTARIAYIPASLLKSVLILLGRRDDFRRLGGSFELRLNGASERLGWVPRHSLVDQLAWEYGRTRP